MNLVTTSNEIYPHTRLRFIAAGRKIFVKQILGDTAMASETDVVGEPETDMVGEPETNIANEADVVGEHETNMVGENKVGSRSHTAMASEAEIRFRYHTEIRFCSQLHLPPKEAIHDSDEQLINAIHAGSISGKELLVTVDTAGQVCIWDCGDLLADPKVCQLDESAWSIAFSRTKIYIGSNSHTIHEIDPSTLEILRVWNEHEHNVPSVAISSDDRWLGSVSIDSSFCLRDTLSGEMTKFPLGKWGWTCCCISVEEIEFATDYGISKQGYKNTRREKYKPQSSDETGNTLDYFHDLDYQDNDWPDLEDTFFGDDIDVEDMGGAFLVPHHITGWTTEEEDTNDDEMQGTNDEEAQETNDEEMQGSYESDTGVLNRERVNFERLERTNLLAEQTETDNSQESPAFHPIQVTRLPVEAVIGSESQLPQHFNLITTEEPLQDDHLFVVTTSHDLEIYSPTIGRLASINLSAFRWGDAVDPRLWLQFNRFCMAQWVPQISALFLGNQAGFVTIIRFMLDKERRLQLRGMSVHGDAPLAGFTVYQSDDKLEHVLYLLLLDGRKVIARIERILQPFNLQNLIIR